MGVRKPIVSVLLGKKSEDLMKLKSSLHHKLNELVCMKLNQ